MGYTGSLTQSAAWKDLQEHYSGISDHHMRDWFN